MNKVINIAFILLFFGGGLLFQPHLNAEATKPDVCRTNLLSNLEYISEEMTPYVQGGDGVYKSGRLTVYTHFYVVFDNSYLTVARWDNVTVAVAERGEIVVLDDSSLWQCKVNRIVEKDKR